jgi:hypothetical protein
MLSEGGGFRAVDSNDLSEETVPFMTLNMFLSIPHSRTFEKDNVPIVQATKVLCPLLIYFSLRRRRFAFCAVALMDAVTIIPDSNYEIVRSYFTYTKA